jgi:hypothetical protein
MDIEVSCGSEDETGPRWYVKVRCPASASDPRAVLDIPADYFLEPGSAVAASVWLNLGDPQIETVFELLHTSLESGTNASLSL